MAAGEPVTDRMTVGVVAPWDPSYPYPEALPTDLRAAAGESDERRRRYAWLYDDEDIWASGWPEA